MEQEVYEYLVNNAVGFDNRVKGNKLQEIFGIKDNKTFRSKIERIRKDELSYPKRIGSKAGKNGGYFIITNDKEAFDTGVSLIKRGAKTIKNGQVFKKCPSVNQENLELGGI